MLNKKDLIELISVTRQFINLNESVIEKDYYVTQVIHTISALENEYFQLVFCGGTCLAKAHKIVNRMSEDVDFKIQVKHSGLCFSKTRLMSELKKFRTYIWSKLTIPGLIVNEPIVRNDGRYLRIELNYPSVFSASIGLRPHILLEFTLSDIQLSLESLLVKTLIEDTIKDIDIFKKSVVQCIAVEETAIEKWVGLTRKIIAIEREYYMDDSTLVRHIYDISSVKFANRINTAFFVLAKTIVNNDAKQFKNQHPEYFINPKKEIKQSLIFLKNKQLWKERYQEFVATMVYNNADMLNYDKSLEILDHISAKVIESL